MWYWTKEVKTQKEASAASAKPKEAIAASEKPKAPAKAPAKPLRQLMEEDVIPSLKSILEAQDDISELELSFKDNRVDPEFVEWISDDYDIKDNNLKKTNK